MLVRQDSRRPRRSGFTLMEMLVVVAIIVALAGIGGYFLLGALSESKQSVAEVQAKTLTKACTGYYLKHNEQWPESLQQLIVKDAAGGPYLQDPDILKDPWGQDWTYDKTGAINNGTQPDIYTSDPKDPTRKKIGNWPKSLQPR